MTRISIVVSNDQAIQEILGMSGTLVSKIDTNEILDTAGAMFLNRIRDRFLREVDPDEVAWLPSKAGLKRRLKGSTGTLFKSGNLFHSIQLHKVGDNDRSISTDVPYAKYHQNGEGGHVMRKFLGFNDDDQTMYERVVQDMVNRMISS